jgi:hypothetical protein
MTNGTKYLIRFGITYVNWFDYFLNPYTLFDRLEPLKTLVHSYVQCGHLAGLPKQIFYFDYKIY